VVVSPSPEEMVMGKLVPMETRRAPVPKFNHR